MDRLSATHGPTVLFELFGYFTRLFHEILHSNLVSRGDWGLDPGGLLQRPGEREGADAACKG